MSFDCSASQHEASWSRINVYRALATLFRHRSGTFRPVSRLISQSTASISEPLPRSGRGWKMLGSRAWILWSCRRTCRQNSDPLARIRTHSRSRLPPLFPLATTSICADMPFRRHSSDKGHSEHLPERHDDHHDHHDQHEPHDKPRSRFSRFSFRSRSKSPHHGDQDSHAIHGPSLKRVDSAHSHHPHHSPRSPSPTSSLASNHEHGHGEGGHDEIGARSEELSKAVKHLLLDVFDHWSKERGTTAKEVQDHLVEWDDKFYKEVDLFSLSDSKFEDLLRKLGAVNVDHFVRRP